VNLQSYQALFWPVLLLHQESFAADKGRLLQINKGAQAGFQRRPRFREVCTIERIASLQSQRVPSPEPAGLDPEWLAERQEPLPNSHRCRR